MDDRTMLELAKEVAYTVCNEIGPVAMCKDPFSFAQEVGVRLIKLVKAEENEACAKVCESKNPHPDQWSDMSEVAEQRAVTNCAEAIRARMKP